MFIRNKSVLPYAALCGTLIIIGFSAIVIQAVPSQGIVTSFYRMAGAGLVMSVFLAVRLIKNPKMISGKGWFFALLGGLFFGLDMACWSTGIRLSNATSPTLLANTAPLWIGFGARLFFKEHLSWKFWLGLVLALLGVVIVSGETLFAEFRLDLGSFFGLLAGIFYGGFGLASQKAREEMDTPSYFAIFTLTSAVILFFTALLLGYPLTGFTTKTWGLLILNSLGIHLFGWLLAGFAQGKLPATVVSPILLGQPLITGFLAIPILGEPLSPWQIVGGSFVLTGIFIVVRSKLNQKKVHSS